jgi:hypothetical protein
LGLPAVAGECFRSPSPWPSASNETMSDEHLTSSFLILTFFAPRTGRSASASKGQITVVEIAEADWLYGPDHSAYYDLKFSTNDFLTYFL